MMKRGEQIWQWVAENIGESFVLGHGVNVLILDDEVGDIKPFWTDGVYGVDCKVGLTDNTVKEIIASVSTL